MKRRSRQWHFALASVVLLTQLLIPAAVAGASEPAVARLVQKLERSRDPQAAYAALSAEDKADVDEFMAVVTIEEADTSSALAASTGETRSFTALAASSCWTFTKRLDGKNYYGMTMWSYFQRIDWCGNGSTITDVLRRQRWGEVYHAYWSYTHIDSATSGGAGKTWYWAYTQAEFKYCPWNAGCGSYRYPWIDMTVKPNGTLYGSMGG